MLFQQIKDNKYQKEKRKTQTMTVLPAPRVLSENDFSFCGMSSNVPIHLVDVCYYSIFPHLQKEKAAMLKRCYLQWRRNHLISHERRVNGGCCYGLLSCYHTGGNQQKIHKLWQLHLNMRPLLLQLAAGDNLKHVRGFQVQPRVIPVHYLGLFGSYCSNGQKFGHPGQYFYYCEKVRNRKQTPKRHK